jgi:hypothetical protein
MLRSLHHVCLSVCPSTCLHAKSWRPLRRFSRKFTLRNFTKIGQFCMVLLTSLYTKTSVRLCEYLECNLLNCDRSWTEENSVSILLWFSKQLKKEDFSAVNFKTDKRASIVTICVHFATSSTCPCLSFAYAASKLLLPFQPLPSFE